MMRFIDRLEVPAWLLVMSAIAYLLVAYSPAIGQELPRQPDLDLPVLPEGYAPGAPGALIPPDEPEDSDDPRDEPPPVFYGEEIEGTGDSLVYVIDFSCSMNVEGREEKAEAEFERSVSGLAPSMRFGVVLYSCQLLCWPMEQATPAAKAGAIAFVKGWGPNSGTATGPAVAQGLELDRECTTLVLLTDGEPNCGADGTDGHRTMIRSANAQGAAVNVFGIAASGTWRAFCQDVARDSGGTYVDVP